MVPTLVLFWDCIFMSTSHCVSHTTSAVDSIRRYTWELCSPGKEKGKIYSNVCVTNAGVVLMTIQSQNKVGTVRLLIKKARFGHETLVFLTFFWGGVFLKKNCR